jgi:hypothetical protein
MKTAVLIQPLPKNLCTTLGALLTAAKVQGLAQEICDETYGKMDQDWKVEIDHSQGVVVRFRNANDAMRFKLAWNPSA